jgi:molecular chaperone DnaK (HSP70)
MLSNEIEETKRKIRVSRAESGASDDVKSVIARYGSKRKFKHYVRSLEKRIEVDKEKLETEKENLRALEKNLKEE